MEKSQINQAIGDAFSNLAELNTKVYDYWIGELYANDGSLNNEKWNEQTLHEMEKDVMMNSAA